MKYCAILYILIEVWWVSLVFNCGALLAVVQEMKGGRSYHKLGYADINLAEFAGAKHVSHCYLLDGYNSRSRQDNSLLKVTVDMTQRSGDFLFKVLVKR